VKERKKGAREEKGKVGGKTGTRESRGKKGRWEVKGEGGERG